MATIVRLAVGRTSAGAVLLSNLRSETRCIVESLGHPMGRLSTCETQAAFGREVSRTTSLTWDMESVPLVFFSVFYLFIAVEFIFAYYDYVFL